MAYIVNQEELDNNNMSGGGGSITPPSMGNNNQTQQFAPTPNRTRFTNIQQFLQANQNIGQNIAGRFTNQMSQATQQATSGIADVRSGVERTAQKESNVQSTGQSIRDAINQSRQVITTDPRAQSNALLQATPEQLQEWSRVAQGDTSDAQAINQEVNRAASQLQSNLQSQQSLLSEGLGDARFRSRLMQRAIKGGPSYSMGMRSLDTLVGEGIGGQQIGQNLVSNLGQVGLTGQELIDQLQLQKTNFSNLMNTIRSESEQLQPLLTNFESDIFKQSKERGQQLEKDLTDFDQFIERLNSGEMSLAELNQLLTMPAERQPAWLRALGSVSLEENEIPLVSRFSTEGFANEEDAKAHFNQLLSPLLRNPFTSWSSLLASDFDGSLNRANLFQDPRSREILRALFFEVPEFPQILREMEIHTAKLNTSQNPYVRKHSEQQLNNLQSQLNSIVNNNLSQWFQKRQANPNERVYQEALANKFFREKFGVGLGSNLYDTDLRQVIGSAIDRSNLTDRAMTQQEAATINALRQIAQGNQAQQLSLENRGLELSNLLNPQAFSTNLSQAIEDAKRLAENRLQTVGPLRVSGEHRDEGRVYVEQEFNPWDWYQNNRGLRTVATDEQWGRGPFGLGIARGTSGNWSEAERRARGEAERRFEDLMRNLGFRRTFQLR